ncbi:transcription factor MYB124-like isoform X1 [Mangifera indica]|uniref:transcription factor MYB124-like isoform X1 n=2 Tax=Mangifera indica TaxID=29780 RepID=UPI001CF9B545|nr:transcription factor MYB124-like isoform X1 [Mangifera indica]
MKKSGGANGESKKKERHIVTWSQQEDDILREQISKHGTDNWSIIASKFKDKTTRQCRRRWYTYLNSDFKKGGWSPEEDMLLCEAQKIFGNRWTEIAKVVSGRTDNAVKNRFSTLCKKRAKYEALAKENNNSYMNTNKKRILFQNAFNADGTPENTAPVKRVRRSHIPDLAQSCNIINRSHRQSGTTMNPQLRPPFTVLVQNLPSVNSLPAQHQHRDIKEISNNAPQNNKTQVMFLKKDDPKITALMQQAELLSSLALKVNTENTEQSLENAWKVVQDYLNRSKENDILRYTISDIGFQFENFKDLIEDLRSSNEESHPSWRQPDLYEDSPASSEYSTGSTLIPHLASEKPDQIQAEVDILHQNIGAELQSMNNGEQHCLEEQNKGHAKTNEVELFPSGGEITNNNGIVSVSSITEFSSPIQVTPLFRSLAAGIPSPKFSESERNFLLRTLGIDSPSPNPSTNPVQPPPCKRALLQSL